MADRDRIGTYKTIDRPAEGKYTVKMSRFLAFAIPCRDTDEAKAIIKDYPNTYHDARHVCWAYVLHPERDESMSSDNGEPSGTAGRPILGQINSFGLTDVLVIVVRYFGGIKLGTPGLIAAYREAARLALEAAGSREVTVMERVTLKCRYEEIHKIMKVVKNMGYKILHQEIGEECVFEIEVPAGVDLTF